MLFLGWTKDFLLWNTWLRLVWCDLMSLNAWRIWTINQRCQSGGCLWFGLLTLSIARGKLLFLKNFMPCFFKQWLVTVRAQTSVWGLERPMHRQLIVLNQFLDFLCNFGFKNIGLTPGIPKGCFQHPQDVVTLGPCFATFGSRKICVTKLLGVRRLVMLEFRQILGADCFNNSYFHSMQ